MRFKLVFTKTQLYMTLLGVSLFFFPSILRTTLIDNSLIEVNFLACVSIMLLIIHKCFAFYKKNENSRRAFIFFELLLWFSFMLVTIYRKDYRSCGLVAVTILLPTFLLDIKIADRVLIACSKTWMRFLKISSFIMIICGLFDLITGYKVSAFFANVYQTESLFTMLSSKRLVSYMGHSLLSGEIFLITYVTYYLYNVKCLKEKEKIIWFIVCAFGCMLTQSKACVALIIISFILFHFNWKEHKKILIGFTILLAIYMTGALDNFIARLIRSIETNNLTTNRHSALISLVEEGAIQFAWFKGQNIDYGWKMVAALEYPILRWAYQFGVAVSICLTIICFILPICNLIKQKAPKDFLIGFAVIAADVNCYNGLALTRDHMLLYCVTVLFITNMARLCRRN